MTEASAQATRRHESRPHGLYIAPGQLPFVLRTLIGSAVLGIGANVVGAAVVTLLVYAVGVTGTRHQSLVLLSWSAFIVAGSVVVGTTTAFLMQKRTLRWILRAEIPSEPEAKRAVRRPLHMAILAAVIWGVDDIVICIVAAWIGVAGHTIFGLASGILLAGLSSSGITYLVLGRVAAPVIRMALAAYPPGAAPMVSVRARLLLIWALTTAVPVLGIVMILLSPPHARHIRGAAVVTAVITLWLGALATALAARAIGNPLRGLVGVLEEVGRGELDAHVLVDDPGEIGLLQNGVNEMLSGLRERDRVQDLFGRHVGLAVAEQALRSGVTLAGETRRVVALFVDITGSTQLTRTRDPAEFVAMLNRFFEVVVDEVERNGGLVNKFEGDGALCVFGAPVSLIDAEASALRAARGIRDRVVAGGEVSIGIGVASGPVVAGQVGAQSRLEYTVVGDAVNEAARLTDAAKGVPGCLLASADVVAQSSPVEREHWTEAMELTLRGRERPTRAWSA